ncbi:MAG TPA: colanic acid biosynthesis acetyltransferase WcaF [Flavobacteriales bacterium]|nr:colanic acid biosynthesis acetyltransferase WcaF [Crocinitomicaceae bacterium]HAE31408.1 colanic acid biosynthesis acetyltransferase WcaF [Flavobacteriales bacterium]
MNKTDLSSFNNDWYRPGSKIKRFFWYFFNVFFLINPCNPLSGLKIFVLRMFGAKIGKGVCIKQRVNIKYPWNLEIGNNVWIGEMVWIDNLADVRLEDNVCLSQGAMLLCGNHDYRKTSFDLIVRPIILEEGVWIGARSVVCPGVMARSHALLTVNSVATGHLEPYSIYQGNPAVKIRERKINES